MGIHGLTKFLRSCKLAGIPIDLAKEALKRKQLTVLVDGPGVLMSLGLFNLPGLQDDTVTIGTDAHETAEDEQTESEDEGDMDAETGPSDTKSETKSTHDTKMDTDSTLDDSDIARVQLLPDYAFIHRRVCEFVRVFQRAGVRLLFYFESASCDDTDAAKLETRCKRSDDSVGALVDLMDYADGTASELRKHKPHAHAHAHEAKQQQQPAMPKLIFPPLLNWQLRSSVRSLGAEVVTCVGEADFALSVDGRHKDVFAVLAGDSDFFITHGIRYIPSSTLQLPASSASTSFTASQQFQLGCSVFTASLVASALRVSERRLTELAVWAGNDYSGDIVQSQQLLPGNSTLTATEGSASDRRITHVLDFLRSLDAKEKGSTAYADAVTHAAKADTESKTTESTGQQYQQHTQPQPLSSDDFSTPLVLTTQLRKACEVSLRLYGRPSDSKHLSSLSTDTPTPTVHTFVPDHEHTDDVALSVLSSLPSTHADSLRKLLSLIRNEKLPTHILSVVLRGVHLTSVYVERVCEDMPDTQPSTPSMQTPAFHTHDGLSLGAYSAFEPFSPTPAQTQKTTIAQIDASVLVFFALPSVPSVHFVARPLRAAFGLLCGRETMREYRRSNAVFGEHVVDNRRDCKAFIDTLKLLCTAESAETEGKTKMSFTLQPHHAPADLHSLPLFTALSLSMPARLSLLMHAIHAHSPCIQPSFLRSTALASLFPSAVPRGLRAIVLALRLIISAHYSWHNQLARGGHTLSREDVDAYTQQLQDTSEAFLFVSVLLRVLRKQVLQISTSTTPPTATATSTALFIDSFPSVDFVTISAQLQGVLSSMRSLAHTLDVVDELSFEADVVASSGSGSSNTDFPAPHEIMDPALSWQLVQAVAQLSEAKDTQYTKDSKESSKQTEAKGAGHRFCDALRALVTAGYLSVQSTTSTTTTSTSLTDLDRLTSAALTDFTDAHLELLRPFVDARFPNLADARAVAVAVASTAAVTSAGTSTSTSPATTKAASAHSTAETATATASVGTPVAIVVPTAAHGLVPSSVVFAHALQQAEAERQRTAAAALQPPTPTTTTLTTTTTTPTASLTPTPSVESKQPPKQTESKEAEADLQLAELPITKYRQAIIDHVRDHAVTVIQGETGCGKSSRVPLFLLQDWQAHSSQTRTKTKTGTQTETKEPASPASPFIVVTQPRRIAAISLAKRVASEMGEQVGHTVGYLIGQERSVSAHTRLVFVTTGWLLQKLVFNPQFLSECTHVILDEIHERDIDADLLYVVIKRLLRKLDAQTEGPSESDGAGPTTAATVQKQTAKKGKGKKKEKQSKAIKSSGKPKQLQGSPLGFPRLILMSATFNTDLFAAYFQRGSSPVPKPIFVGVHRFKSDLFFIDDVLRCPTLATLIAAQKQQQQSTSIAATSPALLRLSAQTPSQATQITQGPVAPLLARCDQLSFSAASLARLGKDCFDKFPVVPPKATEQQLRGVLVWLCRALTASHANDSDGNCVLVFLSGILEIEEIMEELDSAAEMQSQEMQMLGYSGYANKPSATATGLAPAHDDDLFGKESKEKKEKEKESKERKGKGKERNRDREKDPDAHEYRRTPQTTQPTQSHSAAPPTTTSATTAAQQQQAEAVKPENRPLDIAAHMQIVVLHSLVDGEEQLKVFEPLAPGMTRIVLATNIAESSVTIPHVRYVIDTGGHKEIEFSEQYKCPSLVKKYTSQASAQQRAGRTGRLFPGTVFRLYSRQLFEQKMQKYDTPEMQRVSLDSTILRLKVSSAGADADNPLRNPRQVLADALEPPPDKSIQSAYDQLLSAGALAAASTDQSHIQTFVNGQAQSQSQADTGTVAQRRVREAAVKFIIEDDESESEYGPLHAFSPSSTTSHEKKQRDGKTPAQAAADDDKTTVTPLGKFLSALPFSLSYGRVVALAVIMGPKYVASAVVMAASLSMQEIFVLPHPKFVTDRLKYARLIEQTTRARLSFDHGQHSDALAAVRIFAEFAVLIERGKSHDVPHWCFENGIHLKRLRTLVNTVSEIALRLTGILGAEHQPGLRALASVGRGKRKPTATASTSPTRSDSVSRNHRDREKDKEKDGDSDERVSAMLQLNEDDQLVLRFVLCSALWDNLLQGQLTVKPSFDRVLRAAMASPDAFHSPEDPEGEQSHAHSHAHQSRSRGQSAFSLFMNLDSLESLTPERTLVIEKVPKELLARGVLTSLRELQPLMPHIKRVWTPDTDGLDETKRGGLAYLSSNAHANGKGRDRGQKAKKGPAGGEVVGDSIAIEFKDEDIKAKADKDADKQLPEHLQGSAPLLRDPPVGLRAFVELFHQDKLTVDNPAFADTKAGTGEYGYTAPQPGHGHGHERERGHGRGRGRRSAALAMAGHPHEHDLDAKFESLDALLSDQDDVDGDGNGEGDSDGGEGVPKRRALPGVYASRGRGGRGGRIGGRGGRADVVPRGPPPAAATLLLANATMMTSFKWTVSDTGDSVKIADHSPAATLNAAEAITEYKERSIDAKHQRRADKKAAKEKEKQKGKEKGKKNKAEDEYEQAASSGGGIDFSLLLAHAGQPASATQGKETPADSGDADGELQGDALTCKPGSKPPSIYAVAAGLMQVSQTRRFFRAQRLTVFPDETPQLAALFMALLAPGTLTTRRHWLVSVDSLAHAQSPAQPKAPAHTQWGGSFRSYPLNPHLPAAWNDVIASFKTVLTQRLHGDFVNNSDRLTDPDVDASFVALVQSVQRIRIPKPVAALAHTQPQPLDAAVRSLELGPVLLRILHPFRVRFPAPAPPKPKSASVHRAILQRDRPDRPDRTDRTDRTPKLLKSKDKTAAPAAPIHPTRQHQLPHPQSTPSNAKPAYAHPHASVTYVNGQMVRDVRDVRNSTASATSTRAKELGFAKREQSGNKHAATTTPTATTTSSAPAKKGSFGGFGAGTRPGQMASWQQHAQQLTDTAVARSVSDAASDGTYTVPFAEHGSAAASASAFGPAGGAGGAGAVQSAAKPQQPQKTKAEKAEAKRKRETDRLARKLGSMNIAGATAADAKPKPQSGQAGQAGQAATAATKMPVTKIQPYDLADTDLSIEEMVAKLNTEPILPQFSGVSTLSIAPSAVGAGVGAVGGSGAGAGSAAGTRVVFSVGQRVVYRSGNKKERKTGTVRSAHTMWLDNSQRIDVVWDGKHGEGSGVLGTNMRADKFELAPGATVEVAADSTMAEKLETKTATEGKDKEAKHRKETKRNEAKEQKQKDKHADKEKDKEKDKDSKQSPAPASPFAVGDRVVCPSHSSPGFVTKIAFNANKDKWYATVSFGREVVRMKATKLKLASESSSTAHSEAKSASDSGGAAASVSVSASASKPAQFQPTTSAAKAKEGKTETKAVTKPVKRTGDDVVALFRLW